MDSGKLGVDGVVRDTVRRSAVIANLCGIVGLVCLVVGVAVVWYPIPAGVVCIIGYWCECFCCSKTMGYLCNVMDEKKLAAYIVSLQSANPVLSFSIQNWHMETRTRQVSSTDSQGNTTSRSETYQARVDTHSAATQYPILGHTDETLALSQMIALNRRPKESESEIKNMIFLCKFPLDFHPRDAETESDYPAFRQSFYQQNTTDTNQDKSEVHQLEGVRHLMRGVCMLTSDGTGKQSGLPFYMKVPCFVLASLLFMSVPYRKYMYSQTRKTTWPITKHFSCLEPTTWTAEPINSLKFSTDASLPVVLGLQHQGDDCPHSEELSPGSVNEQSA